MHKFSLIFGVATVTCAAIAQDYDLVWIEPLPGSTLVIPAEVNDKGQVVGTCRYPDASLRAFIWEDGITTDLGSFGGTRTGASDINEAGVVVGASTDESDVLRAFTWTRGGGMKPFFRPGSVPTSLSAINSQGDLVGGLHPNGSFYPGEVFRKTSAGFEVLPRHYAISSVTVADINDAGIAVGFEVDEGSEFGLPRIWGQGTSGILPGGFSYRPLRINNKGSIAGTFYNFYSEHPAAWFDGVLVDLPTYNWMGGWAFDINEDDDIVGFLFDNNYRKRAVMWRGDKIIDLNDYFPAQRRLLEHANAMNNCGVIVGYNYRVIAPHRSGFVLIPK